MKIQPLAPVPSVNDVKDLSAKRRIKWLEEKISAMHFFRGSFLSYVSSSRNTKHDLLKLDANENYFIDPSFLKNIFLEALEEVDLRLYNPSIPIELRDALAKYLDIPAKCVWFGSGSEHLIDFFIQYFLAESDEAISIVPSFLMYERRVRLRGAKLIKVPLREDLSINVDEILRNCSNKTKLVFVCSPNNPTGNQFSWESIETLADNCSAIIMVDEAYAEFGDGSICPKAVKKGNILVVRTFSKAFGLAGLRFGYFAACGDLATALSEVIPYTVSTLTSCFVTKLLGKLKIVNGWIDEIRKERERLIKKLHSVHGIEVFDSKTNFVTFRPNGNADQIHKELLKKGIAIKNLGNLPVIGHCLRVTVGLPSMNNLFLEALAQVMRIVNS